MGPPPIVTGISPKEGPPGTRVTIRGEYLGREQNDLIGMLCLFLYKIYEVFKIIIRFVNVIN